MALQYWSEKGEYVYEGGKYIFCDECPCVGTGTGTIAVNCPDCVTGGTPYNVSAYIPSLSSYLGGCDDCPSLGDLTYIIEQAEVDPCVWEGYFDNPSTCRYDEGYTQVRVRLTIEDNSVTVGYVLYKPSTTNTYDICFWGNSGTYPLDCDFSDYAVSSSISNMCSSSDSVLLNV